MSASSAREPALHLLLAEYPPSCSGGLRRAPVTATGGVSNTAPGGVAHALEHAMPPHGR